MSSSRIICLDIRFDALMRGDYGQRIHESRPLLTLSFSCSIAMARHENPFDMQIKLLMIGDSGNVLFLTF